jgi:hypothetical protein
MTFTYQDTYDPLAHRDAQFINILYCTPVGQLAEMDRSRLRDSLAKARLVCHWLEGILQLVDNAEQKGE